MEVFFYGLFMDTDVLLKNGVNASNPRKGYLNHYALKIGARASLIPSPNKKAYGIVMTVDDKSIHQLYAEASVADYIPEEVSIVTDNAKTISAICYNLPLELISGTNSTYAQALFELAKRKKFPENYLQQIKEMI